MVVIAAQPFLVDGLDGEQDRQRVPDLLLGHVDGAVTVVDVKAASRVDDPTVAAQFAWTRRLCEQRGFRSGCGRARIRCCWRTCGSWPATEPFSSCGDLVVL